MIQKLANKIEKFWRNARAKQMLVFGGMFAGLFLIYASSLNIYLGTPVTDDELRFTQGLVGFSFVFTTLVLLAVRR